MGRRSFLLVRIERHWLYRAEICEDVWTTVPPSIQAAREGATLIVNCSASDETIGKETYRREAHRGPVGKTHRGIYVRQCRRRRIDDRCGVRRTQYYR